MMTFLAILFAALIVAVLGMLLTALFISIKMEHDDFKCYEFHRPNMPINGCEVQCDDCRVLQKKRDRCKHDFRFVSGVFYECRKCRHTVWNLDKDNDPGDLGLLGKIRSKLGW